MNFGQRVATGAGIGVVAMLVAGGVTYAVAPPIDLPAGLAWAETYGRIGIAVAVGWAAFVACWFVTVLSVIISIGAGFE